MIRRVVVALVGLACIAAGVTWHAASAATSYASVWVTTADGTQRLSAQAPVPVAAGAAKGFNVIKIGGSAGTRAVGFGASITGATAYNVKQLPSALQTQLLSELFDPNSGIGLDLLRQPMGSTDFNGSAGFYSYDDAAVPDPTLANFAIMRDETEGILPLVRAAIQTNPAISVIATPWSAPAWMKTNNDLRGGSLHPDYVDAYADYFVKFLQAYAAAGVSVDGLTIVNEPNFANSVYPSMSLSSTDEAKVIKALDPKLTAADLDTTIWAYDHNWDDSSYAADVLNQTVGIQRVVGAAFHCYATNKGAMGTIASRGKRVMLSECSGTDSSVAQNTFADTLMWQFKNLIIDPARSGSESAILWNVALDANGGPHQGFCGTRCNGLVEVADGAYTKNADFFVLGQAARFIERDALRLTTNYPVPNVVFQNPDGRRVILLQNTSGLRSTIKVSTGANAIAVTLPARSIATVVW